MRIACYIFMAFCLLLVGCKNNDIKNYEVNPKDSANFSVFVSMLYPQERLIVKINDYIILSEIGNDSLGSPSSYKYFKYPDSIKTIDILGSYNDKVTFERVFKDTLVRASQRSVFISRPFSKDVDKGFYESNGDYITIDSAYRTISLEDDSTYYKDTWSD